jgi:flagellar export protein FliJ
LRVSDTGQEDVTVAPHWVGYVREYQTMKSRDNLVRLKQFQVNEKKRQLQQLDAMIAEFDRMAGELDLQIANEEKKAGITDVNHFAYPTFAKAARQRRDNLQNSKSDLVSQRQAAETLLDEAEAELAKAELLESRDSRSREPEQGRRAYIG